MVFAVFAQTPQQTDEMVFPNLHHNVTDEMPALCFSLTFRMDFINSAALSSSAHRIGSVGAINVHDALLLI